MERPAEASRETSLPVSPDGVPGSEREWSRGGLLVLTAAMGLLVSSTSTYSTGLFIEPVQREFGWARGDIAFGLTLISITAMIFSPFVGYLVDRFGARAIAIPGLVIYCLAFGLLSTVGGSVWSWWFGWLFVAFGALFMKPTVWTTAVAARFNRGRGLAMAATMCGMAIGAACIPFLADLTIRTFGWRMAYQLIGGLSVVIVLPLTLLFFFDDRMRDPGAAQRRFDLSRFRELGSSLFIRLAFSGLLVTAGMTTITINFVPVMSSLGVDRSTAAAVAGLIGLASLTGRFLAGYLLDRVDGRIVGFVCYVMPVAACAYLLVGFDGSVAGACAIALILGLCVGGEIDVLAYLTSKYFPLKNYGIMFGTCVGMISLGSGSGALFANVVYDLTGSYRGAVLCAIPIFLLATLLVSTLSSYELPARARRRS